MNHPDFTQLRRHIDDAITYHDLKSARKFAGQGLALARSKECLGEVMYFKAQVRIIGGHFEEAIAFLEKALEFNPKDGAAYNDLALCMVELGKINGVAELFDKGIEVEPDYATIYHNKGWFLNKLGYYEEALVLFRKALELEPDRPVTHENMADAFENLGRTEEAIKAYKMALEGLRHPAGPINEQIRAEIERLEK
jgi:tetratricopeptide (TPR) repeat protein